MKKISIIRSIKGYVTFWFELHLRQIIEIMDRLCTKHPRKKSEYFIFVDAIYLETISKTCHPAHVRGVPSGGKYWPMTRPRHFGTGVSENELLLITAYRANNDESPHCCAGVVSSRSHHHHHHQHQQDDRLGSVFEDPGVVLSIWVSRSYSTFCN